MKIAAITDIHDNSSNLTRAMNSINADKEIELVINCGDIGPAGIITQLSALDQKQYVVFSPIDLRHNDLVQACTKAGIEYFFNFGQVEAAGRKIGFAHEEWVAREHSKDCDVMFFGHWHDYKVDVANGTLFVCCGEILARRMAACYAVYDIETGQVERVDC